ncbi:ABC-type nitrate/sulfonate/bicarbonate transport system permease component [Mesorhizobium soli]|uniref:ABC transporter permease n=1 Tax=Pseudaminobacter soli (ex Li et al. 2025) TaxID=1295366 RepID=UPI002473EDB5|nr:ABC transporter permease subunit [Mesorhizobium soli]MDH6229752.1 ABC-type nitrate/sulfonate/bicarbonate transport system permease component [Mesorhizobium soli]
MSGKWRGWVVPLVLVSAAEFAMHGVQSYALAAPSAAASAFAELAADGTLWRATFETLGSALAGVVLGGGLGLVLGLWLGLSRTVADAASLSVELLRPIPSVAMIPIALLAFGFGWRLEIAIIAFACLWPMLVLTKSAVAQVEPRLFEVAQVLRLTPMSSVLKLIIPAALPRIFVAFRLCVGVALVVAVTVEIAANPQGLGYSMILAQQTLHPENLFAMLAWTGLLGWSIGAGLLSLQRRLFAHYGGLQ